MRIDEKDPLKTKIKLKQEPYRGEDYVLAHSPLRESEMKRSGRFCVVCGHSFCEHRARESAMLIVHSRNCKDGAFVVFPKDIALMIGNMVYKSQLDFLGGYTTSYGWSRFPHVSGYNLNDFRKMGTPSSRPKSW